MNVLITLRTLERDSGYVTKLRGMSQAYISLIIQTSKSL